jgi:hypothetical protein
MGGKIAPAGRRIAVEPAGQGAFPRAGQQEPGRGNHEDARPCSLKAASPLGGQFLLNNAVHFEPLRPLRLAQPLSCHV